MEKSNSCRSVFVDKDTFCSEQTVKCGCRHGTLLVCLMLVQLYLTLVDKFENFARRLEGGREGQTFTVTHCRDFLTKLVTLIVKFCAAELMTGLVEFEYGY